MSPNMSFLNEAPSVYNGGMPSSGTGVQPKSSVGAAIIGGVASLIGGWLANRSNKKLAEQANQWSVEQWNRENEYNSPINQMKRLAEAGINPALAYSQGIQNSAATSPSVTSAVGTQHNVVPFDAETASRVALNDAQADKLRSETDYQVMMNKVEKEIQSMEFGGVHVSSDGNVEFYPSIVNGRVELFKRELTELGLSNSNLEADLAGIIWDLALETGSDSPLGLHDGSVAPSEMPNYDASYASRNADKAMILIARDIQKLQYEALKASNSGTDAYNKWIEEIKDTPLGKLYLLIHELIKQNNLHIPAFSINSQSSLRSKGYRTSSSSTRSRRFSFGGSH